MHRRLVLACAIAVVVTAAFLPGSGFGSSAGAVRGTRATIPAGLADAIHGRLGPGAIMPRAVASLLPGPFFGFTLALSADGKTALVGAAGANGERGAAYVFHVSDAGSWSSADTPTAVLTNKPGPTKTQLFGFGVALSADGTTAFVSAFLPGTGATYVFHVSADNAWVSTSTPTATLTGVPGTFLGGLAVSPDGTTLVLGRPFYFDVGGAYVFHVASESDWVSSSTPTATLSNASGGDVEAGLGVAISGDGTTVLVSASVDEHGHGGAYVFHVASAGSWTTTSTPTAILSDTDRSYPDYLGEGVALSGDGTVAFLSAPGDISPGVVDVFHASGEAAWASTSTPTATLTTAGGVEGDHFGTQLAVSTDGTTALVTAYAVDSERGAAYIFRVADEGSWASSSAPTATLTNGAADAYDQLGAGVLSADGTTALLGAPGVHLQTGAAYVFHVADVSSWATSSTPNATLTVKALGACVVPKLKGLRLSAVKHALAVKRCKLGRVTRVHSAHRKGRVLSQSRKAGTRLAINAKVNVKVGR